MMVFIVNPRIVSPLVGSAVEIPSEARPPGNYFQSDLQAPRTLLEPVYTEILDFL